MAKQIIDDTVMENIEILAKLALTCEEREKAREKMQEMLDYIDKLNELNTDLLPIRFMWKMCSGKTL